MLLGGGMNSIVMTLNDDCKMPVRNIDASSSSCHKTFYDNQGIKLWVFADIINIYFGEYELSLSIGDILIYLGGIISILFGIKNILRIKKGIRH